MKLKIIKLDNYCGEDQDNSENKEKTEEEKEKEFIEKVNKPYPYCVICKGSFQKKKRRKIWKIPYLGGGGGPVGSFSICYHGRFKMHRKSF